MFLVEFKKHYEMATLFEDYHYFQAIIFNILTTLQYIFNLVLTTGVFSHSFKNTIIIPLHKQLNKSDCTNDRPIALTITLSKVLEKCIKDRLYNFLETCSIFSSN